MSSFIVDAKHIAEISKHYDALPHRSETFYNPVTNQKIDLHRATSKAKELPFKTVLANLFITPPLIVGLHISSK